MQRAHSMNLKSFVYLFLTDLVNLNRDYKDYVSSEPGYAAAWLKAYIGTFKDRATRNLSHSRLKKIHQVAVAHLPKSRPGEYKKESNFYSVHFNKRIDGKTNFAYTATKDGLKEFIQEWLKRTNPIHAISVEDQRDLNGFMLRYDNNAKRLVIMSLPNNKRSYKDEDIEMLHHFGMTGEYNFIIAPMATVADEEVLKTTEKELDEVFLYFNKQIEMTTEPKKKLKLIISAIQKIAQIHPFDDGNIRTCYILLNVLLRDAGLSPTILIQPNRFDLCHRENLETMVKSGQELYKLLIDHGNNDNIVFKTTDPDGATFEFVLKPKQLFDVPDAIVNEFCEVVLGVNPTPTLKVGHSLLFSSDPANELLNRVQFVLKESNPDILEALKKQEIPVALRKACSKNLFEVIKIIMEYHSKLKFDINGQSSNKNTALDWLLQAPKQDGKVEILKLLRNNGAKTQADIAKNTVTLNP